MGLYEKVLAEYWELALYPIAYKCFSTARQRRIALFMKYCPCTLNVRAEYLIYMFPSRDRRCRSSCQPLSLSVSRFTSIPDTDTKGFRSSWALISAQVLTQSQTNNPISSFRVLLSFFNFENSFLKKNYYFPAEL